VSSVARSTVESSSDEDAILRGRRCRRRQRGPCRSSGWLEGVAVDRGQIVLAGDRRQRDLVAGARHAVAVLEIERAVVLMVTPVSELGALPFAVAALTPKLAASWVDWLRLRLMLWPLGTVSVTGEPESACVGLAELQRPAHQRRRPDAP